MRRLVAAGVALTIIHVAPADAAVRPPTDTQVRALADCESGDGDGRPPYTVDNRYARRGYFGAFNFTASTWRGIGGEAAHYRRADQAPALVQIDAARRLVVRSGWHQFPACSRRIGAA